MDRPQAGFPVPPERFRRHCLSPWARSERSKRQPFRFSAVLVTASATVGGPDLVSAGNQGRARWPACTAKHDHYTNSIYHSNEPSHAYRCPMHHASFIRESLLLPPAFRRSVTSAANRRTVPEWPGTRQMMESCQVVFEAEDTLTIRTASYQANEL